MTTKCQGPVEDVSTNLVINDNTKCMLSSWILVLGKTLLRYQDWLWAETMIALQGVPSIIHSNKP